MTTKSKVDSRALARKRAEQLNRSPFFKLQVGDNCFRILPTPASKTTGELWYEYKVHRDVGPKTKMVRCGKSALDDMGDCWICDTLIPALNKRKLEKRAAAMEAQSTALIQVAKVTMEGDEPEFQGPLLFQPSAGVFRQLLTKAFGSKKRSYTDPDKGYNLNLDRSGTGKNDTRYGILEGDDDPTAVPESIVEKLKPFSALKEIPKYDEAAQKSAYKGDDVDDEEDEDLEDAEDDEELPASKKKSKASKVASDDDEDADESKVVDEDEDDDDEPTPKKKNSKVVPIADEDDEDETPPAKKGKPGKKKPVDDDEDEDFESDTDDEDDDEDDAPTPSKKKKKPPVEDDEDEDTDEKSDDDGDDVDVDEDDEDEPAPKKKTTKKPVGKRK